MDRKMDWLGNLRAGYQETEREVEAAIEYRRVV